MGAVASGSKKRAAGSDLDRALAAASWAWWFDGDHRSGTTLTARAGGADGTISSLTDIAPATLGGRGALTRGVNAVGDVSVGTVAMTTGVRLFVVFQSSDVVESEIVSWYGFHGHWIENVAGTYPQLGVYEQWETNPPPESGTYYSGKEYAQLADGDPHVVCMSYNATHASHTLHVDGALVATSLWAAGFDDDPAPYGTESPCPLGITGYGLAMTWGMSAACAYAALSTPDVVTVSQLLMDYYGVP
jgi:hypothetical protein